MNRNLRTIITDKDGLLSGWCGEIYCRGQFRPFFDLIDPTDRFIKQRKLPDGRTKYYIRTNVK